MLGTTSLWRKGRWARKGEERKVSDGPFYREVLLWMSDNCWSAYLLEIAILYLYFYKGGESGANYEPK